MSQDLTKISTQRLLKMFRSARACILSDDFLLLSEEEKTEKRSRFDDLKKELDTREHLPRKERK